MKTIGNTLGKISFALLVLQVVFAGLLVMAGLGTSPGGHPPGGVIVFAWALTIVAIVAPAAFLFGLVGWLRAGGKLAAIGTLGNFLLMPAAQWAGYLLLGCHRLLWAAFFGNGC